MPPKKKVKRKKKSPPIKCDIIEGEKFHAQPEDVLRFNWWEVFCFPYILCARVWDCFVNLCSGTNQCLVYWMMVQWLVCKITKLTTPDPILFPYYFNLFCQVILLTAIFVLLWMWFGRTVLIPYFLSFYHALIEDDVVTQPSNRTNRLSFRRYCFRKGEIFETSFDNKNGAASYFVSGISFALFVFEALVYNVLNQ